MLAIYRGQSGSRDSRDCRVPSEFRVASGFRVVLVVLVRKEVRVSKDLTASRAGKVTLAGKVSRGQSASRVIRVWLGRASISLALLPTQDFCPSQEIQVTLI